MNPLFAWTYFLCRFSLLYALKVLLSISNKENGKTKQNLEPLSFHYCSLFYRKLFAKAKCRENKQRHQQVPFWAKSFIWAWNIEVERMDGRKNPNRIIFTTLCHWTNVITSISMRKSNFLTRYSLSSVFITEAETNFSTRKHQNTLKTI